MILCNVWLDRNSFPKFCVEIWSFEGNLIVLGGGGAEGWKTSVVWCEIAYCFSVKMPIVHMWKMPIVLSNPGVKISIITVWKMPVVCVKNVYCLEKWCEIHIVWLWRGLLIRTIDVKTHFVQAWKIQLFRIGMKNVCCSEQKVWKHLFLWCEKYLLFMCVNPYCVK